MAYESKIKYNMQLLFRIQIYINSSIHDTTCARKLFMPAIFTIFFSKSIQNFQNNICKLVLDHGKGHFDSKRRFPNMHTDYRANNNI